MKNLMKLCNFEGVSGFEFELGEKFRQILEEYCDCTETDILGNVIGRLGNRGEKTVMIEAHLDEIGLMVKDIDDNGFVRFAKIGGINPATLPSAEVFIHGKERVFGVIGAKPPHLQSRQESSKNYRQDEMYIDTGFFAAELRGKIQIGDAITFAAKQAELLNGRVASKAIDNRMGLWCLAECAKRLKEKQLPCDVVFLGAVQEEVGCRGAKVGAYTIAPDCAVVIDVTHAVSPYTTGANAVFPLDSGVAIAVGPNLHPALSKKLIDVARTNEIPYTIEVCSGNSGTDAWVIQTTKKGIPCALLSAPLRYMHTQVETLSMADAEAVVTLICNAIEEGLTC